MEAIFNHSGDTVGWLKGKNIFTLSGQKVVAYTDNNHVCTLQNVLLGFYQHNFFRDKNGHAVAFTRGAQGGPVTPVTKVTPVSPVTAIGPVLPVAPVGPVPPVGTFSWSSILWPAFLSQ